MTVRINPREIPAGSAALLASPTPGASATGLFADAGKPDTRFRSCFNAACGTDFV
jgi:hypothetical protein